MTRLSLRNAVAAASVVAFLSPGPAWAQYLPELPSSAEFRRALAEAPLPPPVAQEGPADPKQLPHSKWFRASEAYAWGGTAFDGVTTARGIALGASEAGPLRIIGARNTPGILITGAAVEVGLTLLSRKLYREGHPKVATTLNFFRGSVHIGAGAHNIGVIRQMR